MTVTNSWVSGNRAVYGLDGGGIFNSAGSVLVGIGSYVKFNKPNDCVGC